MWRIMKSLDNGLSKACDLTIVALLLIVPLLVDIDTEFPTGPSSKNFILAYGAAIALLFLGLRFLLFGRVFSFRAPQAALGILGVFLLFRALYDPRPDYALGVAAHHIGSIAIALLLSYLHRDRILLRPYFVTLTLCGGITVVYAVSQILDYDLLFRLVFDREGTWYNEAFEEERAVVFSTFGNPNYFAHFLGPLILLGVAPALLAKRNIVRLLWLLALLLSLYVGFRTYNRGIWLGLFAGGVVWIIASIARRTLQKERPLSWSVFLKPKYVAIAICVLFVAGVLVKWLPMFEPLVERFRTLLLLRDTSVRSRLLFWFIALVMWRVYPWIGVGMGRYDPKFFDELLALAQGPQKETLQNLTEKMVSLRAVYAHNDYVQFLAEWGAIGLGLFLLVVVLVLAVAVRIVRRDINRSDRVAFSSVGLLAAFASFLVQLFYDFPLHLPASELLFFFVVGAILIVENESGPNLGTLRISNRLLCVCLGFLLIIPFAWSFSRIPAKFGASHRLYHGQNNNRAKNYNIADREYETAIMLDSENGEIIFHRAVNYAAMGKVRQALDLLPQSLETYQTSSYYYYLGMTYLARSDYTRAMDALQKLVQINPYLERANYALGLCYYRNPFGADFKNAAIYFQREVSEYPEDLRAWLYLGDCKFHLNDLYGAKDAFHKAWELRNRTLEANERLGDIYAAPGELFDQAVAIEYYKRASDTAREDKNQKKYSEIRNKIEALKQRDPDEFGSDLSQ